MADSVDYQLRISGYGEDTGVGRARVDVFQSRERWIRAFKGLGLSWLAAFGTAFIPVAHFVLVPIFFLFGIVTFFRRIGTESLVTAIEGTCPDCGADQVFDAGGRWQENRSLSCRQCRRGLRARAVVPTTSH